MFLGQAETALGPVRRSYQSARADSHLHIAVAVSEQEIAAGLMEWISDASFISDVSWQTQNQ
jgi:hypothetical protein